MRTPFVNLGRYVFGVAALASGLVMVVWPDYRDNGLQDILNASSGPVFVYGTAAAQIFGGAAMLFRHTARAGAVALGVVYLAFALLCLPQVVSAPLKYGGYGNFFLEFSLVVGALLVYEPSRADLGRILWGVCATSFALYQAFYLDYTATLVPKWFPPSQMFWTIATTVAFALAAVALLINRQALLATRLLTLMLVLLGLFVWVPALLADPHSHSNWNEFTENFAIAGAAWILADLLAAHRRPLGE
ncbi:MAG TPA: hypothetical protein VGP41_08325 [Candidatus Lustribacter sp.]|nr:hypothetical protein [Candidatus Lustribacter sp.]